MAKANKADPAKADPQRQCIITREAGDKAGLLRFVCDPAGMLVPDIAEKLPGRGIWVSCRQSVLKQAIDKKAFGRAAKRSIGIPEGLDVLVASLLYQRAFQALGLARKAGDVVSGAEKVAQATASGQVIVVLHASDAAEDGRRKLASDADWLVSDVFSRDDLCQILGKDNVAHAAILNGKAGQNFLKELRRFSGFMEEAPL